MTCFSGDDVSEIEGIRLSSQATRAPSYVYLISFLPCATPLLYGCEAKVGLLAVRQIIRRLHGFRGRRRGRILQTHAVRNLRERWLVLPASGQEAFMLPGGCGRNKAGRPGGRYRRAFVLGDGDDAVVDSEAVAYAPA